MIRTTFDDPARGVAVLAAILLAAQPLLAGVQGVARSARRRARAARTARHAIGGARVDVVLMCANLDDDLRARWGVPHD